MVNFHKNLSTQIDTGFGIFFNKQYKFFSENPQKLINSMSKHDQTIFPFDVRKINLEKYMEEYVLGIRKFILKEDQSAQASEVARRGFEKYDLILFLDFFY